jgi:predicted nucleotidyltransferase
MMNNNPLIRSLKEVCSFLDEAAVEYMLVGGLAVGIWAEPRATVDIDFLVSIHINDFEDLKQRLTESNRFVFIHDKPMVFGKVSFLRATLKSNPDISLDFLFVDDVFKNEALKRKKAVQLTGFSVNISTPEDLIVLKLVSGREQDKLDASKILDIQRENLDIDYLRKCLEKLGVKFEK